MSNVTELRLIEDEFEADQHTYVLQEYMQELLVSLNPEERADILSNIQREAFLLQQFWDNKSKNATP
jgi:hypothetical protein